MSRKDDEIIELLERGDRAACVEFFRGMPEKQRRTFAKAVLRWALELEDQWVTKQHADGRTTTSRPPRWAKLGDVAVAAGLACLNAKEIDRAMLFFHEDADWEIIEDRRPPWLEAWAQGYLDRGTKLVWKVMEAVDRGLIEPPEHEHYLLGHIPVWGRGTGPRSSVASRLRGESAFCTHGLWRLFEVEGTSDCSLAGHDKYAGPHGCWADGLVKLSADGALPRERLLDASLEALARDFMQFRAGWFSRFHEQLKPTTEERADRQDAYLHLLGSTIPPTVAFAVKALAKLDKAGQLSAEALLGAIEPTLHSRTKATVNQALRLLLRASKRSPECVNEIAVTAARALSHESADVQKKVLDLLDQLGVYDDSVREEVAAAAESVAASLRNRLTPWVDGAVSTEAVEDAAPGGGLSAERVLPIASGEELLKVLAAVLESPTEVVEVERVLDGMVRLSSEGLDTAALVKRAEKLLVRDHDERDEDPIARNLCQLTRCWGGGAKWKPLRYSTETYRGKSTARLFILRLTEIAAKLGRAAGMLSLLTDTRGWIDPELLVQRALEHGSLGDADQVLALLRLGTEGRPRALERAGEVGGEFGRALRFALGAKGIRVGTTPWLWAAAARSRDPRHVCASVQKRFPELGPGGAGPGSCTPRTKQRGRHHSLSLEREAVVPKDLSDLIPTVRFHQGAKGRFADVNAAGHCPSLVKWSALVAPGCTEDYFAVGIERIDVDWVEVQWEVRQFFEPMLYTDVVLGPNAYRLLVLGLAAKEAGQWGMAVECCLAAIGDGRFDVEGFGAAFAEWLTSGLITAGRWQRSLAEVARVSKDSASLVRRGLERGLRGDAAKAPKDLAKILDLLHELCVEAEARMDDAEARAFLENLTKSGKTAALRKELLAL